MRTKLQDEWFTYDGIELLKVKRIDSSPNMPSLGQINCFVYVLSKGTPPNEQFSIELSRCSISFIQNQY